MRTYGLTMIPTSDSIVPVLLPFYTAESQNSLERGSRPYSVVEILREVFKEDFQKAIQSYQEFQTCAAERAEGGKLSTPASLHHSSRSYFQSNR